MIHEVLIFVGYFDWFVIFVLIYLNIKFWKSDKYISGCILLPIFGLVLPILSIAVEFQLNGPKKGESFDSFTMLYTYFRFPLYWILFIIQYIILKVKD
jgi:hypothetical protein